jgi:signal transduction histidine kinase
MTMLITHVGMTYEDKPAVLEIFQDITERKQAEEQTRKMAELKSKVAAMASHEIRSPLSVIGASVRNLLDGLAGDLTEKQRYILTRVGKNVDSLTRLALDILDYKKYEEGKYRLKLKEEDINEIIKKAYNSNSYMFDEKKLYFRLDLAGGLEKILVDEDKIMQVFDNLISNAAKFTGEGGITVSSAQDEGFIRVSVSDTGRGLPKEDLSKLFIPFADIDGFGGKKPKGTGLGLAISKEIIEGHNGTIWAESVFGQGSTFHFILPASEKS